MRARCPLPFDEADDSAASASFTFSRTPFDHVTHCYERRASAIPHMLSTWSNANTLHGAERGHAMGVCAVECADVYCGTKQGSKLGGTARTAAAQRLANQARFAGPEAVRRDSIRSLFVKLSDPDDSGGVGRGVSGKS